MSCLIEEHRGGVAFLTINDPGRRNAMSCAIADELVVAFDDLALRGDARAVVLTGAPPAFSAGADLGELEIADRELLLRIYRGFLAVAGCPLPTIAAVNGPAIGAGLTLALACDVRVAARSAVLESRFLDLALHPGGGHLWMLERLISMQGAAAMALLGEPLSGDEAARRGLAWRCVEDDRLLDEAYRLASKAAAAPPELVRRIKQSLISARSIETHAEAVEIELEDQLWSLRQHDFSKRLARLRQRVSRQND